MPRLDIKTIQLSDGSEHRIRFTWQAVHRFREATKIDMFVETETDRRRLAVELNNHLATLIHSLLATKEAREAITPEEIGEAIDYPDTNRIMEDVYGTLKSGKEGQQNVPFVNGVAGADYPSNPPTPSGGLISV